MSDKYNQIKNRDIGNQVIRLHIISETEWVTKGKGVHTAFVELTELLKKDPRLTVAVNNQGTGDIFHSHTYGPYYFRKGWKYKGRRILTAHVIPESSKGTIPFWKQLLPLTSWYLKLAYKYADIIIAISPTVEETIRKMGVESKIVRIYNPVLTEKWKRSSANRAKGRELLGIDNDEQLVLGVGQLQERKGVEDFIDIAAAMPETRFVWVGGRPWGIFTEGISRIDDRIANAPANIQFVGLLNLDDMPAMYAAADIFLFPSYQENCPLAPLEAAAAGLPIVFRDIPEYSSLYARPYLKAKTTSDFIAETRKLLQNDLFYQEAQAMSALLLNEFDQYKIRNELVELYRSTYEKYLQA